MQSCRSLQSLMTAATAPTPSAPSHAQLPTPPLAHAALPMKLRLRARPGREGDDTIYTRRRVVKRSAPRGVNKRRRDEADDMGREGFSDDEDIASDLDIGSSRAQTPTPTPPPPPAEEPHAPSTPKRARIAPEQLPLGLERSDFHDVHSPERNGGVGSGSRGSDVEVEADGTEWSAEDDRILVELVLEKLKLSKSEWQDCARSLGKDRHSAGRRWKSLVNKGDVGLKRSRRAKLHSTWR